MKMKLNRVDTLVAEALKRHYPVAIHFLAEDDGGYFMAYLPDFGYSACSATGDSEEEALASLKKIKSVVFRYYVENGKILPKPSRSPFNWLT